MLDRSTTLMALDGLGRRVRSERDIELLVVGGAAGMLTRLLPATWTTGDIDTMHCFLPTDRDAVFDAAADMCHELGLPADWLNDWSGLYRWTLPDDWASRRVLVGKFDRLHVYACGRSDFIAMKVHCSSHKGS